MLKYFREIFAADLRDTEFQREFIAAAYEEGGPDGVVQALREVASANRGGPSPERSLDTSRTLLCRSLSDGDNPTFKMVRSALNAVGLDFAVVPKQAFLLDSQESARNDTGPKA